MAKEGKDADPYKPPRLGLLLPDALSEAQRALYDRVLAGARDASGKPLTTRVDAATGGLLGPFNAMLLSPQLGTQLIGLADCLRFGELSVSQKLAETVILYTVHRHAAQYPFWSHMKIGRAAGVSDATIEALRRGEEPRDLAAEEVVALRLAKEVLQGDSGGRDVTDPTYQAAVDKLGERGVFEVVALTGFYSTLSRIVNTFTVPVPAGETPPLSRL
eukprot:TRINITY_DN8900_c0_g1_i3.p1 TRINITY_DN8900_c0_g1~~TRINITY_DN8900_c0_g1_i3.p1  ORF type:complete len:217 (+),score=41.95 TRINITY_DN8900_c0_g1_i3:316-966(+)